MDTIVIKIAKDYTPTPGPRYIHEGKWSGEKFRQDTFFKVISNAIHDNNQVVVDLDGTAGYGTSFLEEIFGGLIREHHFDYNDIINHIKIISNEEPYLTEDIYQYLKDADEKKLVVS